MVVLPNRLGSEQAEHSALLDLQVDPVEHDGVAVVLRRPEAAMAGNVFMRPSSNPDPASKTTPELLPRHAEARMMSMTASDDQLGFLSHVELVHEVLRLREGVRAHRDSSGHDLCWHHPQLWTLLPDATDPLPEVPEWPQFMRGCIRYRQSLDEGLAQAPRTNREHDS